MQEVTPDILKLASKLIHYVGGLDNISGLTSGKGMLLSIKILKKEYVIIKKIEKAPFISDVIYGPTWVTFLLEGVNAHEVEMAIKLYEKGEIEKLLDGLSDEELLIDRVFVFFQRIFSPLLIVIVALGILQAFITITMSLGLVPHLYSNESVLTTISGSFYYFLPVIVAFSTAKYYNTNPYVAVMVAGILLHPSVIDFISKSILGNILHIHTISGQFSNSILPILFLVMFQANLDRALEGKIPQTFSTIFKPFLLLVSSVLVGIFFFGPLMILMGNALLAGFEMLLQVVPWLATAIMGAFGPLFVMTGVHYSLFPLVKQSITSAGYETLLGPGMLMMNAAHAGVSLGVAVSLRQKLYQVYGGTAFLLALVGVSQPTLYGVEVFLKKPFLYAMIAGGAGGLFAGIMEVKAFGYVNPGIFGLSQFSKESGNLLLAVTGMFISFLISFYLCWRAYQKEPADKNLEAAITGDQKRTSRFS